MYSILLILDTERHSLNFMG